MTTIVYDGKTLASDSQSSIGSRILDTKSKKVFELKGNKKYKAVAFCGSVIDSQLLLKWFKGDMKEEDYPVIEECSAIAITNKGKIHFYYNSYSYIVSKEKFCAMGSGEEFAIASIMSGNNAVEAVKVAIKLDVYSGGRVQKIEC